MVKRKRKKVTDKEKTLILQRSDEGHNVNRIAIELGRSYGSVRRILDEKGIVLTNKALQQTNSNILSDGVGKLIDLLADKVPDTEIEEIIINPKNRTCRIRFYRDITFTV